MTCEMIPAIQKVAQGFRDAAKAGKIRPNELVSFVERATGMREVVMADAAGGEEFSVSDLKAVRTAIYDLFGAPGNYGYDTPLGDALRDLYEIRVGE